MTEQEERIEEQVESGYIDSIMTEEEVCNLLQVKHSTIIKYRKPEEGGLMPFKERPSLFIRQEVERFIKDRQALIKVRREDRVFSFNKRKKK